MRDLKASKNNLITIQDNLSNTKIGIYHDTIKSSDRIQYQSELLKVLQDAPDSDKIKAAMEYRLNYTLDKITGFTDGSFSFDDKEISSDPESANYYADWKMFLRENASDIIESINGLLFGQPNFVLKKNSLSMLN
ncbi:MAG: hypothetical protein IPL84_03795 [Chitinophagaceae bacterium]|nr:hypothetical protein [Chitinophagaceae bacterium]